MLLILGLVLLLPQAHATDYTWNVDANGNWTTNSNWTPSTANPNAGGDKALFRSIITANRIITLDAARTVGVITFSNVNDYTLGGTNTLTLQISSTAFNQDYSGAVNLNTPIQMTASQTWLGNGSGLVTVNGAIGQTGGAGKALTKSGAFTLVLNGANTFTAGLTLSAGTLGIGNIGAAGTGTLTLSAGTIQADSAARSLTNAVTVSGDVTFGGSQNLTFTATATLTGADRTMTVDNTGVTTFAGLVTDNGNKFQLLKSGAGTLVLLGNNSYEGFTLNAGAVGIGHSNSLGGAKNIFINGGEIYNATNTAIDINRPVKLDGNLIVSGSQDLSISGGVTLSAARTLTVSNTGLTTIASVISGAFGLNKAGLGTLALSGANTFTGTLAITNGTVQLGAANRIVDTVPVSLAGGTFSSGGFSESVGTLALTADSVIDLGAGASILRFTNSSAISWTAGRTLSITNWSGSSGGGGTDQLYFSTSTNGLTASQVAQIRFVSPSGTQTAQILSTGEVVPVPSADVAVTKTGATSVYATSNLTYTIAVTNLGPGTATNVIVSDLLPTNVTFVSATSGGTNGNGTVWWPTMTNWASGSTTNFTVTITAPSSERSLTNTVSSTSTSTDPDSSNNNGSSSNAKVITTVLEIADVKATKTGAASVYETSNLTYTITVTNMGPNNATNVIVSDLFPTNTTFVSASSGGTNNNGSIIWPTMTNFVANATTNFTVTITAPTNGVSLTNTVSSTATSTDLDASNNNGTAAAAKVTTTVTPIADVKTTKSGATTVYATSNLTYTITVTNMGPDIATNLVVSDLLPTNVTFVSASSSGTNGNGTVWWPTMTNFAVGATTNFTVIITVPSTAVSLTNTVSSTNTTTDPDLSNNNGTAASAKVTTTVLQIADVKTTKSGAATVTATSNLTYTITVTNLGPNTATNLIVSDVWPTNSTFVSASSGGTNSNGTIIWPTMTNCAVGFTTNFTVTITAPTNGVSLTNTVSSTATSTDPDASNNDGSSSNAKVTTTVTPIADVKTTKTGASTVTATSNLTYTITVTNLGPGSATNVIVSDLLPTNVTFVSATSGGTNGNGTVWWGTITNCAVGFTTNFTVTITAPTNGVSLTNTVSSTATSTDPDASNNDGTAAAAKVTTTVTPIADVKTTKSGAASVSATSNFTYTITVTNLGPDVSTNVIVSDLLPTNVTFVSASSGGTNASGTIIWPTMTNFAIGASTNFTVTVTAPTSGSLTNTASSSATTTDPDASNNDGTSSSARVITAISQVADVKTTKSGATTVQATSNLTYTLTVTNLGPNNATNVIVSDLLPTNVTFVSASSSGTNGNGTVWWPTMTNFVVGATTNFTVTVTAPSSGSITNTASSTATSSDPDASNNDGTSSSAKVISTILQIADVKATKTGAASVYETSNLTYTITITNLGPNTATNVVVSDLLPTNVTFVSASSGGTNGNGTVWWGAITNFAAGATTNFTVTITAPTNGVSLTNTVSSTATSTDPDASNNNSTASNAKVVTTVTPIADVKTTKSGATTVYATSNLTYTITVTNMGPDISTNVIVSDLLPTNVTFVSASSGGTNASGTIIWPTMTNFAIGATTNFTVTVTAPSSGSLTNTASSSATTTDPDSSNNDGTASNARVITSVTSVSDLKVTKSGAASVTTGSNLTYTITFTNLGPNSATNAVVTDTLPTNTTFVSASSGGSYSAGVVTWPAMTNITTTNFTVTITAPGSGPLTNSAAGTSSNFDPDASNSDGSASNARVITTVTPSADVFTTKSGPTSASGTSNITYTITVTNHGPSTASNVVVSDTLPANVTFVSASSGGTTNAGIVTWPTLTNFANAAFTNFTVVVTLPVSGSVTNTVASTSDTGDPDASNNNGSSASAKVVTTVGAVFADIATSVSGPSSAAARTNITYTITVTNMGPGTSSNVVVLDTLPAGVTFVSASGGGNHSGGVVTWPTLTNFANAAATNFTVTVTVPDSGMITNIVSSTSVTSDPVASNNDGSSASGQVVTLILGVNVTGFAYLDANKNGFKDTSEAGTSLTLYAKIYATTNASGPALQAAVVDGTSGAYTLTNITRGLYMVILDNNNLLSDVTPTLPGGWTGGEMPAHIRTNVAVALVNVPDQNFGLIHSLGLSGKVFKDNGAGGGTANDGVKNGSEIGLGGVTVRLTDTTGSTVYDTATTDGNGDYTLLVPSSVANGATLKITETNPPVHLSTGASVGDTGGTYDRASDTVTFTYTTGTAYSGVNFGDVPENSFVNDSQQANLPGTFVLHPHSFTAGSGGSLSFSVASLPNPSISGWTQVIYRDANCNGQLDPGETAVTGALTVSAGDKVCILIKEFIPGIAPFNAQDQLTVTAAFTWTGASPALSTNTTRIDLTTVGNPTTAGLTLIKSVNKETALPGEVLTYTVTYANHSSAALTNIVIFDQTPAFTTFSSAGYGALPNSFTGIAVTSPGVGATGAIKWTFTGSLAPASASTVTFSVTVSQ